MNIVCMFVYVYEVLMKYLKILMLGICAFSFSASFAATEIVERMCRPILEKKCSVGDCKDVNLSLVVDGMYNKCESSVTDVENLKAANTDVAALKLNSDVGYLIGFSNLISRALAGKAPTDKFANVKQDYTNLTNQYKNYLKNNRTVFLSSLDFLDDKGKNKELKAKILEEDKASQQKVNERIKKLDVMMQSEDSLAKYRVTHTKFIPAILFENNAEKFKGKTFTAYECSFLKMNFDEAEIKDLEKTLNYTCEK
jgi:hypothetical protein